MVERARLLSLDDESLVILDVVNEERPEYDTMVTTYPVEDGAMISDHVALKPVYVMLEGVMAGEGSEDKSRLLRRWRDDRHRLRYIGRNIITNLVISEFRMEHDFSVGDGYRYRLALEQIQLVRPSIVDIVIPDPVVGGSRSHDIWTQTKEEDNAGRAQPQNSGHPALKLRTDWEDVMSYEEAKEYADRYGGHEALEGYE